MADDRLRNHVSVALIPPQQAACEEGHFDATDDKNASRGGNRTDSRSRPILAVVIPFYKITYFENLLQALAVQTDSRFRVYVGDDQSPTPPVDLLQKFEDRLDITYIRFDQQMGGTSLVRQWNRCLELARDEDWIWMLPDDDLPSENFVEEFYRALDASHDTPNRPSVYRAPICIIDANGNVTQEAAPDPEFEDNLQFYLRLLRGQTMSTLGDNVFCARRLRDAGGFVEFPKGWGSDHATVLQVAQGHGIRTIAPAKFYFRMSGLNISSNRSDGAQKLKARLEFAAWLKKNENLFPRDPGEEFFRLFLHKGEHYVAYEWPISFAICVAFYKLSYFCCSSRSPLTLLKVLALKARVAWTRRTGTPAASQRAMNGGGAEHKVKVLHVANWYPNPWDEIEGNFIKNQLELFRGVTEMRVLNVQVRESSNFFRYVRVPLGKGVEGYYILTRLRSGSRLVEWLTTLILLCALVRHRVNRYDLLHIHIAYPLLSLFHVWKRFIRPQVLISEHWSAYHFGFWLPAGSRALARIQRIFHHRIPVVGVSEELLKDILLFSGRDDFEAAVLPNVVDAVAFQYREHRSSDASVRLFAVNRWREIKNPFPLLEALAALQADGVEVSFRVGGFGPLEPEMREFVQRHALRGVTFLGKLDKFQIADELASADAYAFTSLHETFSVACAEALCCGCPLIGPALPAILEYTGSSNHVIVSAHTAEAWKVALLHLSLVKSQFRRREIAAVASARFNSESFLKKYREILSKTAASQA